MTQVFNVDQLKVTREIMLGGKVRAVRSMTVGQFIESEAYEKKLQEAPNDVARVSLLVDMVQEYIEDTEKKELLALDLVQLVALLSFIRGKDAMEPTKTEGEAGGAEKGEDKAAAETTAS